MSTLRRSNSTRRALSLLELMIALVVTAMVAGAISGMMHAVTTGVVTRRDNRSTMVGANTAAARLGAYIAPARCILDVSGPDVVVWLNDSRESGTIHATEIRWLLFDAGTGTITVHFVDFPDGWSQAAKDLEDQEYASGTNWSTVLSSYQGKTWTASIPLVDGLDTVQGKTWTASIPLVDGLDTVNVIRDEADPLDARHVMYELSFDTTQGTMDIDVAATVRMHQPPTS
jgi:hypothetical protein